jgi:hypothetical protein
MEIIRNIDFPFYSDLGFCFCSYSWLYKNFKRNMGEKLAVNSISSLHATSSVILGLNYLYTRDKWIWRLIKLISTGYFLHDARLLIYNNDYSVINIAYLFHHVASIYYLRKDPKIYNTHQLMFWAELSNLPSYLVYYLIKKKQREVNNKKLLSLAKFINMAKWLQFAVYSTIRIPFFGYLTYKTVTEVEDKKPIFIVLPVYLMGVIWTSKLWKALR